MGFTIYSGRIDITEPGGSRRPYERFTLTVNPDGSRTLRTITRSPRGDLLRDVQQQVAADWRPMEALGRLYFQDKPCGSVLRRVVGDKLQSWVWNAASATPDYAEFEAPPRMSVGFHPIFHDAWKMSFHDTSHHELQEVFTHTVSNTWNGQSLGHGRKLTGRARFAGTEEVEVPAGRFACDRFVSD